MKILHEEENYIRAVSQFQFQLHNKQKHEQQADVIKIIKTKNCDQKYRLPFSINPPVVSGEDSSYYWGTHCQILEPRNDPITLQSPLAD